MRLARRATMRKKRQGPAMQYLSPARERAWEKMSNSCFPARPARAAPRFIPVVIFIRGREARRKLDRNVFTSRLFIKPSTAKQIRSIYTASLFALLSRDNVA